MCIRDSLGSRRHHLRGGRHRGCRRERDYGGYTVAARFALDGGRDAVPGDGHLCRSAESGDCRDDLLSGIAARCRCLARCDGAAVRRRDVDHAGNGSFAFAISAMSSGKGRVIAVSLGVLVAMYLADVLGNLADKAAWLMRFSLFHYWKPNEVIDDLSLIHI